MKGQAFYVIMAWMIPVILLVGFSVWMVMTKKSALKELEALKRKIGDEA